MRPFLTLLTLLAIYVPTLYLIVGLFLYILFGSFPFPWNLFR